MIPWNGPQHEWTRRDRITATAILGAGAIVAAYWPLVNDSMSRTATFHIADLDGVNCHQPDPDIGFTKMSRINIQLGSTRRAIDEATRRVQERGPAAIARLGCEALQHQGAIHPGEVAHMSIAVTRSPSVEGGHSFNFGFTDFVVFPHGSFLDQRAVEIPANIGELEA